jgi:hypothetical protein
LGLQLSQMLVDDGQLVIERALGSCLQHNAAATSWAAKRQSNNCAAHYNKNSDNQHFKTLPPPDNSAIVSSFFFSPACRIHSSATYAVVRCGYRAAKRDTSDNR